MPNDFYVYMYLTLDGVPFYIGKGKDNRASNISGHLSTNHRNSLLKNKIRKVGVDNIKIHFLHINLAEEAAFRWEKYWIKYIGRRDLKEGSLCNLTEGGDGSSGRKCSEETRKKISNAQLIYQKTHLNPFAGKTYSSDALCKMRETVLGRSPWNKGIPRSEETRRKISKTSRGQFVGKNNPMYGKIHTEGTKQKISRANKGRKFSDETKQKMSKAQKGRAHSPETCRKMQESAKRVWERRRKCRS